VRRHALRGATAIDLAENMDGSERACHLELAAGVDPGPFGALGIGLVGLSAQRADRRDAVTLSGTPEVVDVLRVGPGASLRLRRHVRSFFQGNRFLVTALVDRVAALVAEGPVVDLYAGVGLFGLSLAAVGREAVTLVEGDPQSGVDLEQNARPFADRTTVARQSVESFVASRPARAMAEGTVVVDPPRTGLSREALAGLLGARPPRMVYVSCDMATLARDTRALIDAGYALRHLEGVDLFPNSAHVEAVAAYTIGA
jgi:tRNA/tmRNA/rRNA uracil-C5-methylase (TrmA/RlmC/RlmD family)